MRAFKRTLSLLSLVTVSFVVSGCGQDFVGKIACTVNTDCLKQTGTLFPDGSAPELLPMCCSSICVLPAGGCDTGYRYLDNDPGYGDCIKEDPMCPALPDMSMPEQGDMS